MSDTTNPNVQAPEEGEQPRRRKRKRRRRNPVLAFIATLLKILGTLLLIGITTGALLCVLGVIYIQSVIMPQVPIDLSHVNVGLNSTIYYYDENGVEQELRTLHGDESRVWVKYADLPQDLINATIAIEDKRFLTHKGVDWKRTAAAVFYMFTGRSIQGGSTLTQQLLKNVTGYDDTNVKRKVIEIFRALDFDATYGKNTTLEWYLSYIWFGRGCRGVYTASYKYFGKNLNDLTVAEYASLISITNNPSLYDPYTNPENNRRRQLNVLYEMHEQGYLTDEQYEEAKNQEMVFTSKPVEIINTDDPEGGAESGEGNSISAIYSWYEEATIDDVVTDLMAKYGYSREFAMDMVLTGGLKIYACVDPRVQAIAESVYQDLDNFNYPSKSGQPLLSAITIINNETGDVAAIVGNVGEKTTNRGWNIATKSLRQPGSSIKPLAVYAPALDMGLITPLTVFDDYPYELSGTRGYPSNSNGRYSGLTTVYSALTRSLNTVSFRILTDLVTPRGSFDFVENRFHIDLVEARQEGNRIVSDIDRAPLSLGGLTDGVNTRDMAEAYASFPNQGIYRPSRTYSRVVDRDGNVLLDNQPSSEVAVKESTAWYINTILSNAVAVGTGTDAKFSGMHIAGKTGSTSSYKDRWFAGYTPYYTAVVWTGYSTPEKVTSGDLNPAAVTWRKVMSQVHEGLEDKSFFTVNNTVTVQYCMDSGLLVTDACRCDTRGNRVASMTVLREDAPTEYCTVLHSANSIVTICKDSPILDANGKETGVYHLAGEFCPEESKTVVSLLDYQREPIGTTVVADDKYTLAFTMAYGFCDVHTEPILPDPYDPNNPYYDPNNPFNPYDPNNPYNPYDPNNPYPPVDPTEPGVDPNQPLVWPADPNDPPPEPNPDPDPGPGDEPYVPAGNG